MCAQCGHATLGSYRRTRSWASQSKYWRKVLDRWSYEGQKKIAVKVTSEQDLKDIQQKALEQGIPCYMVADAGHTQIAAGSLTVCGLGPCTAKQVAAVTSHLKLL